MPLILVTNRLSYKDNNPSGKSDDNIENVETVKSAKNMENYGKFYHLYIHKETPYIIYGSTIRI